MNKVLPIVLLLVASMVPALQAQRKITPVDPRGAKPATTDVDPKANLAERLDAEGNVVFVDTITGEEWIDTTIVTSAKMIYPLMESVTVGVNLWDPVMMVLGQQYGGVDVWAELSLHNRYKPVFEFGMGSADITPDGQDYTFKAKLSPYFKIGVNYNIFYNNNPRYQMLVGVRYGFTPFSYEVRGDVVNDYWGESTPLDIPSQSTTAGYFEFMAGVRVGIVKNLSLGWMVKYHTLLHEGKAAYGKPMYVPGFGKRGTTFTGSFSISYTFTLNKPDAVLVDNKKKQK